MKIMKRSFIVLILITYFFIFGRHLPPEITYIPLWVEDLKRADLSAGNSEPGPEAFRLNGKFGYLYDNGKITYLEDLLYGVAIDKTGYISYSRQNDVLVIRDAEGQFLNIVELAGYPFFSGNRRFIISYNNNSINEIDTIGNIIWQRTFSSSITSVSAAPGLIFIGTVDGEFRLIDSEGNVVFVHAYKTSRINVVYGGTVSGQGEHILTVSGVDPQLITLWSRNGENYRIDSTWSIDHELRRHAVTGFSDDGLFAYVEAENELLIIDLKKKNIYSNQISGRLQYIDFPGTAELIHTVGQDQDGLYMTVLETDGEELFFTRLTGSDIMFNRTNNRIILGLDSKLNGFDIGYM